MKMLKKTFFFSWIVPAVFAVAACLVASPASAREKEDKTRADLIEKIPQFNSVINWTTGEIFTEVEQPVTGVTPNLGKTVIRNESEIRENLRLNLMKAVGFVRISDIFQLKEYYAIRGEMRHEITTKVEKAFYYPTVMADGKFTGRVKLDLYGRDGIAEIFFRDIERVPQTNQAADEKKITEDFDGLILDTVLFPQFNPSIQFRIYNEDGVLLYGPETVDKEIMKKIGVCEYTTSLSNAFLSPRSGHRIFYAIPQEVRGRMNTYLVLKNSDAEKLFGNPRTARALNQSRVVIVKPLP